MEKINITVPAKINLTLDVTGTDSRGYHILDMLMHRISLCDEISICKNSTGTVNLSLSVPYIPCDGRNTAYKAAVLFFEETALPCGCDIFIKKNIPSGAGLAGGSADGAGVLKGLNTLYGNPLSDEKLASLALKIGSDVPFMLKSGLCRVKGTGEIIEELPPTDNLCLLLAMPKYAPASTQKVYKTYDGLGSSVHPDTEKFLSSLYTKNYESLTLSGGNALTESTVSIVPKVGKLLYKMKSMHPLYTLMTGSGSVVYGVFDSIKSAKKAEKSFWCCWHRICTTVNSGIKISEVEDDIT